MGKINKDDLGYLGLDFQIRLIAQLVTDRKFANSIMDIVNPNYFGDQHLRTIVLEIKNAYDEYETIPDMGSLEFRLFENVKDDIDRNFLITQLRKIKEAELNDTLYVQDTAMKFCKQQELIRSMAEIDAIIKKGNINDYDRCEEILKRALAVGDNKDEGIDLFYDIASVLTEDFRDPIPTGVEGLDEIMEGGLSKGELAVILAAFGVGKTTMITKVANTAYRKGKKVLQIFFEDMPKVIQRKHLACMSGFELNNLNHHKDELVEISERVKEGGGGLKLVKLPSHGTTVNHIRQYIRKSIAQGFSPDIILVDYIDCIQPSKQYKDSWEGEGNVMREFETMLAEFNIAGWTAVQGNRSSIKSEVVESDQMGGSIKRGQIGHFIVSIAKSMEQRENGTANMAILKSRFGKDGIILRDVIFDNSRIQIDMTENSGIESFHQSKENKSVESQKVINGALELARKRRQAQNNETENVGVDNN